MVLIVHQSPVGFQQLLSIRLNLMTDEHFHRQLIFIDQLFDVTKIALHADAAARLGFKTVLSVQSPNDLQHLGVNGVEGLRSIGLIGLPG